MWENHGPISFRRFLPSGVLVRTAALQEGEEDWFFYPENTWWECLSGKRISPDEAASLLREEEK
jgi:hypothetical protein